MVVLRTTTRGTIVQGTSSREKGPGDRDQTDVRHHWYYVYYVRTLLLVPYGTPYHLVTD
jgi:hypothetical protein